jgi:hypothetical protein
MKRSDVPTISTDALGNLEPPLTNIRRFLDALALISETLDEPGGSAVNVIVHAAIDHAAEVESEYVSLFRLTHPDRERFEREGWPGERGGRRMRLTLCTPRGLASG